MIEQAITSVFAGGEAFTVVLEGAAVYGAYKGYQQYKA